MAYIEIEHATVRYGDGKNAVLALNDVSLTIEKG